MGASRWLAGLVLLSGCAGIAPALILGLVSSGVAVGGLGLSTYLGLRADARAAVTTNEVKFQELHAMQERLDRMEHMQQFGVCPPPPVCPDPRGGSQDAPHD